MTTTGNPTFLTLIRESEFQCSTGCTPISESSLPCFKLSTFFVQFNSGLLHNAQTGARTPWLLNLSQSLLSWFSVHFLSPRATHAGAGLSLQAGTPEGGMNITPFTSGQLWDLFVEVKVDLFASRLKTYCPHSSLQLTTTQPFPSEDSGQGATNLLRGQFHQLPPGQSADFWLVSDTQCFYSVLRKSQSVTETGGC